MNTFPCVYEPDMVDKSTSYVITIIPSVNVG